VPNFLEAQIRAKLSRVKSDMRTIKTAMEAYYCDHNSYCHDDANPWADMGYNPLGYPELTSPVAYFSQGYIRDAFVRHDRRTVAGSAETDILEIGTGDTSNPKPGSGSRLHNNRPTPDCYIINSCGPDMDDDTQAHGYPHKSPGQYLFYDPTNGTVSRGDICRIGGVATWLTRHPLFPADWKQ